MATFEGLRDFLADTYDVHHLDRHSVTVHLPAGETRTQLVTVRHFRFDTGAEWIQIESAIGPIDALNLDEVVRLTDDTICGGIGFKDGNVTFRHAAPLEDLSFEEFMEPLLWVTSTADRLEQGQLGSDRY
jgi:hypothetical protein